MGSKATGQTHRTHRWLPLLWAIATAGASAQPLPSPDVQKAEVVYRALIFVNWPSERFAGARGLQLCLLGEGRLDTALQALAGRSVRQQVLEVRRARADQLGGCHVLYLPAPSAGSVTPFEGQPVLTVSDAAGMLDHGAMINLQIEDGRVVFDVELDALRRAGLDVSAKLLRLARFVKHDREGR